MRSLANRQPRPGAVPDLFDQAAAHNARWTGTTATRAPASLRQLSPEPAGGRDLEIGIVADGAPYRPRRSIPRPVVRGVQTAVVVGPEGEDVHTDQLGRVQVEFHWDWATRKSCWVRVSQGWAGKN